MRLTRRQFQRLVRQAVEELPPPVRDSLENVALLVEDWPSEEYLQEAGEEQPASLFGLYVGVPLPDRYGDLPPLPDTITLFQGPIEQACNTREEVVREIRITVVHEVGHFLGLREEDLDRLGYG
jgi:predicted Zn-dependent protease with MMP-like domain